MKALSLGPLTKGLVVAALHVALVASLGAKLLYDRATRPRVWAQTRPYDPDLPIRGRYLSLQLIVEAEGFTLPRHRNDLSRGSDYDQRRARLEVRSNKLVAVRDDHGDYSIWWTPAPGATVPPLPARECYKEAPDKQAACFAEEQAERNKALVNFPVVAVLDNNVLYFIPEHAIDPTPNLAEGKELWAEVTLPKAGPPRPIQLALKKDGKWMPLDLR
jgi:hypothetical protein